MLNIFLDTNIYLGFYRLTSEDIEKLESLIVLIRETEDIKLFINSQLVNEFYRNRDSQIKDTLKTLEQVWNWWLNLPNFSKKYSEYSELMESYKNFQYKKKKYDEKVINDIDKLSLLPDKTINELFTIAELLNISDEIILKARIRTELWNPPWKKGSLWDAIHWEALLKYIPNWEDIYFVWIDWDFKSILYKNKLNSFLEKEWEDKKSSIIYYYENLSTFLKDKFPSLWELDEYIKEKQIEQLWNSNSFNRARQVLNALLKIWNFTDNQLNKIVENSLNNNQVYWAHRYGPEVIWWVLEQLFKWKHNIIRPELYEDFCKKFDIKEQFFYYIDKDWSYNEIPF